MAGPFYVDDGGDGTTESSWATADTSINNLDAEYAFASGEIVYFGHDMQCQATNSAGLTISGPASPPGVLFISATQGSSPVAYQASTTNQIDTTEGAYTITFNGCFSLYGMSIASGSDIYIAGAANRCGYAFDSRFKLAANKSLSAAGAGEFEAENIVVDLTADGTTGRSVAPISAGGFAAQFKIRGLTFVNAGYRTGTVINISANAANVDISSADFSGFTNGTLCELVNHDGYGRVVINNCITAATWGPINGAPRLGGVLMLTNVGPADAPTYIYHETGYGVTASSAAIYRTGGATVEGDACSWLITTTASCGESNPYYTPWIYATVASTGSKTFDLYITNDTADFTDAQVWLEIEYLGTADEANTALATDHRADILATAANQTDDVTSTWNGTGPSFTYKQKLSASATVNETGMYRARVCVGVASIAGSRYFYVDPKVAVS